MTWKHKFTLSCFRRGWKWGALKAESIILELITKKV